MLLKFLSQGKDLFPQYLVLHLAPVVKQEHSKRQELKNQCAEELLASSLKPSTSYFSKCILHPFFLPYAEKGLLATTLIGAQWSQSKQAMRKVCCASLQVPLFSTSNQCNFPSQLSSFATSFHDNEKGFIRNSRVGNTSLLLNQVL